MTVQPVYWGAGALTTTTTLGTTDPANSDGIRSGTDFLIV
jgi:hypothetical protein